MYEQTEGHIINTCLKLSRRGNIVTEQFPSIYQSFIHRKLVAHKKTQKKQS